MDRSPARRAAAPDRCRRCWRSLGDRFGVRRRAGVCLAACRSGHLFGLPALALPATARTTLNPTRRSRERVCNGNVEQLWRLFTHDSIILWHFRSFARKRSRMRAWAASTDGPPVLLFPHPRDLDPWLATLDAN